MTGGVPCIESVVEALKSLIWVGALGTLGGGFSAWNLTDDDGKGLHGLYCPNLRGCVATSHIPLEHISIPEVCMGKLDVQSGEADLEATEGRGDEKDILSRGLCLLLKIKCSILMIDSENEKRRGLRAWICEHEVEHSGNT